MSTSSTSRAELLRQRLSGRKAASPGDGITAVGREGTLPLSFAQRRLWVLDQISPGGTEYLMALLLRLAGPVDDEQLRRALDEITTRHEVLRSRCLTVDDEPVQVIDAPGPIAWEVADLSGAVPETAEARLDALVAAAGERPFDLAAEHPVRALLVRLPGGAHALLLTLHHIASDGWSESILLSELDRLYTAFAAGEPSPLPPVRLQYADFAAWQRERLSGDRLAGQLDYWRGRLAGLEPLALPTDRPRGPVRDATGAVVRFEVPTPLAEAAVRLGREHGATPYMVTLAVFQLLLGRYCGQTDVAVGSPMAGRDRPETHGMVGLFTNTVVMRTDLSGDPCFTELLARVREDALSGYEYQETPFELLVNEFAPVRDASRGPLVQVLFQLDGDGGAPDDPSGLVRERRQVEWPTAKFDLGLALAPRADGSLGAQVEYATALFDRSTVERLVGHYLRLLESVVAAPERPVSRLEMLTAPERELLLTEWAGTGGSDPVTGTIPEAFAAWAARTPDAIAVTCDGTGLTYAELDARANRLAHRLRSFGAGPERLVGVRLERGPDLVTALLAVLKAGAGYLPLDPGQPAARLDHILRDAAVTLLVSDEPAGDTITTVSPRVPADELPCTAPEPTTAPDDVAYVIYTSGSTGRPKGVPVTHANVLRLLRSCQADFGFGPDDVWTLFHSYAFDFSVWELWGALLHGGRALVIPHDVSRSPADFLNLLITERVTVLNQTPSAFRILGEAVAEADVRPGTLALRTVVFGGEALDVTELASWYDRFGDTSPRLVNMYGITETTVHVTHRPLEAADTTGRPSPIGRPLADLRIYLLDDDLNPVPAGLPGQIFVSGPGLARGYLGRPALTAERFGPDPFSTVPGSRMYRTGDLARFAPGGDLEFLGRADDQVKIRGHRIEPGEIEAALTRHPGVDTGVVLAHRGSGEREARLIAYVTPAAGRELTVDTLREHLGALLPGYMVPAYFVVLDVLPVTANGKTDRRALPDPAAELLLSGGEYVAPRTETERVVASCWSDVLGVARVGVHDNFFALGGDSIRAIRVVGALRRRGVGLTVQNLLVHQSVESLARFATTTPETGDSPEERRVAPFALLTAEDRAKVPADVVDAYPMSMVQAAMVYQMLSDRDESPYHNITLFPFTDDAPFSPTAMRRAAALLAERHEILRTSFDLTGFEQPMQLVRARAEVEVGYDDLRGLGADVVQRELREFTARVRSDPFDVTRAPMLRFHVHQTADDRWTFSFIECHAILDGWSHHSLIGELMDGYRVIRAGGEPAGPTTHTVRFADHIALERLSLASERERGFWRDQLAEFDRVELPAAWAADPADHESAYRTTVRYRDLEPGLQRLAAAAGAPLKSVLFAAHLKVLSIVSGTHRFHTGLVCNGRLETAGGDLVRGMHLNTLPVGVELTGADWTELVHQVFAAEVAVWPHRRFPLPEMQRAWGGGTPLIDVGFSYLDFHVLDHRPIEFEKVVDVSPNEFGLDVWTFPGELFLLARPERISRANGLRLAATYRRVLEAMAADPAGDARTTALDGTQRERLRSFATGADATYPDVCLHELFEQQVARTPDAVALRCADGTAVDYAELNARANRLARRLRSLGAAQESRVAVLLRRGPELVVALLAVLKSGAAYLPLDPTHPAERLSALVAESGSRIVVTRTELAGLPAGAPAELCLVDAVPAIAGPPDGNLGPVTTPDSLAYVIYTSGSTGRPKGVMIEHRSVVNYVCWSVENCPPRNGTGAPLYSSMAFDIPVTSLFPPLASGQPVTLTEDDGTPGIDALVAALEGGGFGNLKLTPSHLALLNQSLSPHALRNAAGRLIASGEELTREVVSRWAEHAPDVLVGNEYGPTEATVACSYLEERAGALAGGAVPIGRPFANTAMRVLDRSLEPAPVGVVGDLYVGGAQVARGYLARPGLTADCFVPDPFSDEPGARLYRTGDLARFREDGVMEYLGRADRQLKIRGYRIEPGEVEAALRREAPLREAAVRMVVSAGGEKELAAYLVPAEGASLDPVALRERLTQVLPAHLVPARYLVLDELPRTPSGKTDLKALPQTTEPARTRRYRAPRTAVENILAKAWAAALGLPLVGIDDSFVELGGHSLTVMRVITKLRAEHGYQLSFQDFYRHRTVAELAVAVTDVMAATPSGAEAADTIVWLRRTGTRPPLFCVMPSSSHWFAPLAEHLGRDRPVAAMEWPGLTRAYPPPESIGHIAALNLAEMRRIAPTGPYHLLGWCGGSQITTEMARRLHAGGEDVTLMLLDPALDTYERENMHDFVRRFLHTEEVFAQLAEAPEDEVPDLRQKAADVLNDVITEGEIDLPLPGDDFWPSRVRVWRELLQTRLDYRHTPFPVPLHLIAGDELASGEHEVAVGVSFADYTARWTELAAGGMEVHRVGGNHLGVLKAPHVAEVAKVVTMLLDDDRPAATTATEAN